MNAPERIWVYRYADEYENPLSQHPPTVAPDDHTEFVRADIHEAELLRLRADARAKDAEIERLREALEPFARYLVETPFDLDHEGSPCPDEDFLGWVYIPVGAFRHARATFEEAK